MASGLQQVTKRFPTVVVLIALAGAACGLLFFFWALRPCPLVIPEGTLLTYRLRTEMRRLQSDQEQVFVDEQLVDLYSLNDRNDIALLARDEQGDRVNLMRLGRDGQARPYHGEQLQDGIGHAIGFFDFNLLPLPQDANQTWEVRLQYGYLPPGRQEVTGQVRRRVGNGPNPEFELRLDTIEWVVDKPYEHWRSLTDMVVHYRYDAGRRIVDRAQITCRYGMEGRSAARYADVVVDLELEQWNRSRQVAAVRDLALATAEVQAGRYDSAQERAVLGRLLERVEEHPRLQILARRLVGNGNSVSVAERARWFVQVASVATSRRQQADAVVAELRRQGWHAAIHDHRGRLAIRVGPYGRQEATVLDRLRALCGADAFWWQGAPEP